MSSRFDQLPKSEEGKLNLYFHLGENSGVGYYRQYLPAIKLKEHGLANVTLSDFRWGEGNHIEPDNDVLFALANWADLIVVGRRDQANFYAQWGAVKEFFKIPIVLDTDDDIRHVRPYNPGYQGYHPGAESIYWNNYGISKIFDAITVTTQDLYDINKKLNPKTFILPNNADVKWWDSFEKKKWNDKKIRIGFIGSAAHWEGVNIIKKPIIETLKRYPQVLFYITHIYMPAFENEPKEIKDRVIPVPWIKLQEWPKGIKDLGLDIGLAPLADNLFNRAKSNLRWLEYSLGGMATIASAVKPYLCIKHRQDGILATEEKEWINALDLLVLNSKLRYNISEAAYGRVSDEFNIDTKIQMWHKTYKEIHQKYYEYFDAKRQFALLKEGKAGKVSKYQEIIHLRRRK